MKKDFRKGFAEFKNSKRFIRACLYYDIVFISIVYAYTERWFDAPLTIRIILSFLDVFLLLEAKKVNKQINFLRDSTLTCFLWLTPLEILPFIIF